MEKEKKSVVVCIPCYNEERVLPQLRRAVEALMVAEDRYEWRVVLVDDGSTDGTLGLLRRWHEEDERVGYVSLSRNFGKEAALLAGFDYVGDNHDYAAADACDYVGDNGCGAGCDCVVVMDADLQDPPEVVSEMLMWWEKGYQDVYARRRTRGRESWVRRTLSVAFYRLMNRLSVVEMPENVGDFRLLDRRCVEAIRQLREVERYNKGLFSWIGFRKKEIVFDRADRRDGGSKWSLWKLFSLAIDGITSFTTAPLRLATLLGAVIAFGAFVFLVFYIGKTLLFGDPVQGFTTLVSIILFLGGVQLLSIGILGEYIARIFIETKRRPIYFVKESV